MLLVVGQENNYIFVMVNLLGYDVEIFPNLFSITIIDLQDYLNKFRDIVNNKNKPVPLTDILSVKQIKERLSEVKCDSYFMTPNNSTQLIQMLARIANMAPSYDINGKITYTHMYGFNNHKYDKLMIAALLMYQSNYNTTGELIAKLYSISQDIINNRDDKFYSDNNQLIKNLKSYKLPYKDIDIMEVFALNKVGTGTNDKGDKIYFGKSLKQTSINIKWYELLEYTIPPISEKDKYFYEKHPTYKNYDIEQLNKLIPNQFNRYIIDEWIEPLLHYNKNDVLIVCEIVRLFIDEIKLRYNISHSYKVDVLSSSRSDIADKLFIKFYSEMSGLQPYQWRGKQTIRTKMSFKKIIFPFIEFKTDYMKNFLEDIKKVIVTSTGKDSFKKDITINKLTYTIATGGIHSQDPPRDLRSRLIKVDNPSTGCQEEIVTDKISLLSNPNLYTNDSYEYVHSDATSFYPSLMIEYNIAPAHLNKVIFPKLVKYLKDTRVNAKHSKEEYIDGIPKEILAQALKIVINSIYGKFSYEYGDTYDRLCTLQTTINGQLILLMLCEELELNGIEVVSANTDGIVIKLYKDKVETYLSIIRDFQIKTKLSFDSEEYLVYIDRDVNNYIAQETNGKISFKGAMNPNMYITDLKNGYDMPIVAKAVYEYLINGVGIWDTLYNSNNILDFCKTQNIGRQFHVGYIEQYGKDIIDSQRNVRYYISNNGVILYKIHNITGDLSRLAAGNFVTICNTLDDISINSRDINYEYYYKECLKIIDPIKLGISPKLKPDNIKKTKSGKSLLKKYSGAYDLLFNDNDYE